MTKNLDPDPDPPSPESPTETFAAPAEVRHFTDGSFPPGFVLQLFSHTQLRTTDSKDSSKDSKAAAEGLPQPQSPSSGEPSREGLVRNAESLDHSQSPGETCMVFRTPGKGQGQKDLNAEEAGL